MRSVDAHAAGLATRPDVVAAEVDEHHVLGALLRIGEQLALERASSSGVSPRGRVPAIGRTSTVPSSRRTSVSGTRRRCGGAPKSQKVHVRRGIDHAHRAIDVERVDAVGRHAEALR